MIASIKSFEMVHRICFFLSTSIYVSFWLKSDERLISEWNHFVYEHTNILSYAANRKRFVFNTWVVPQDSWTVILYNRNFFFHTRGIKLNYSKIKFIWWTKILAIHYSKLLYKRKYVIFCFEILPLLPKSWGEHNKGGDLIISRRFSNQQIMLLGVKI